MTGETGTPRPEADGLVLSAPAVWDGRTMGVVERGALAIAIRCCPAFTVSGRGIIQVTPSDNTEMLRGLARDPMVIKATRIDAIYGLVDLMDARLRLGGPARTCRCSISTASATRSCRGGRPS